MRMFMMQLDVIEKIQKNIMIKLNLLLLVLLSSCSIMNLPKFDNVAYDKINHIRTLSQLSDKYCGNTEKINDISYDLWLNVYEFTNYQELRSEETYLMSQKLLLISNEFFYKKNKNKSYCVLKLDMISDSAFIIQKILGDLPK